MKKGILLLGVGAAAGVVYALEANRRKQNKNGNGTGETAKPESSIDAGEAATAGAETNQSGEQSERAASMARIENGKVATPESEVQHVVDDQGTDQFEASQILKHIRDNAFEASDEKLALALGRPTEEIEQWTSGFGLIDGDVVMKARALAIQRGLEF